MSTVQSDVGRQSKVVIAGVVLGCLALGYVAMTWMSSNKGEQSKISALQTNGKGTPTKESEHYSQVLDRYNRQEAQSAEQKGQTYVSVLSSRTTNVPEAPAAQQPALPAQGDARQQPAANVAQPTPQQEQQRTKEVSEQMQGLMANWLPVVHDKAMVATDAADYAASIRRVSVQSAVPGANGQGASVAAAKTKVVEDFALVPALLDTDIDTDENSMVTATIPSGQYAGAQVYGMGYKRLTNTVDMTFTFMKWQGHSYKITAKALDQDSMRTALSGEVNNRYFARIVLPAIALGIGQAGQLYQQASAQSIISPLGSVVQTYPSLPSAAAVGGTIIGGIANQAGRVLAADAANIPPKQVLIAKGATIGVQFIGPVMASDDLAAGAVQQAPDLTMLSQPAGQPQRQNVAVPVYGAGSVSTNGSPYGPSYGTQFGTPDYSPQTYPQSSGYGAYPRY